MLNVSENDRWFEYDCNSAFLSIRERASKSLNGNFTLVGLETFLFFLYHFRLKEEKIQVRTIEIDTILEGNYFAQKFEWTSENGKIHLLMIIISLEKIRSYPGIKNHLDILKEIGLAV